MNDTLIEYYKNLLIMQYATKPKAVATTKAFVSSIMIFDVIDEIRNGFSINNAVGSQLDLIGVYVGASRYVPGTYFYRDYFGFILYGATTPYTFKPYITYEETVPDVQFRTYEESHQSDFSFTDEELRMIVKLRIIRNSSNASLKDIDSFLQYLFNGSVYVEETSNMTLTYYVPTANVRVFNIAKSLGALPSPSGVDVYITTI